MSPSPHDRRLDERRGDLRRRDSRSKQRWNTVTRCGLSLLLALCLTSCHSKRHRVREPFKSHTVRALADQPDVTTNATVHAMYVIPSDGVDRGLDMDGTVARSIEVGNDWLMRQTSGRGLRLDVWNGHLDVTFVRLPTTDAVLAAEGLHIRDRIEHELAQLGFNDNRKIYLVYYDGSSHASCGGGPWPPELRGRVVGLYLRGRPPNAPPCESNPFASAIGAPGYFEFAAIHEVFHALGAVASCAPHHTMRGHTGDDPRDLMYAGPDPWRPEILDIGRDDYFDHAGRHCVDVARSVFLEPAVIDAELPPGW